MMRKKETAFKKALQEMGGAKNALLISVKNFFLAETVISCLKLFVFNNILLPYGRRRIVMPLFPQWGIDNCALSRKKQFN